MKYLVGYDISKYNKGENRLNKVANICEAYGERIQLSLFEVRLTEKELTELTIKLTNIIDSSVDQIRIIKISENEDKHIFLGQTIEYSLDDILIF